MAEYISNHDLPDQMLTFPPASSKLFIFSTEALWMPQSGGSDQESAVNRIEPIAEAVKAFQFLRRRYSLNFLGVMGLRPVEEVIEVLQRFRLFGFVDSDLLAGGDPKITNKNELIRGMVTHDRFRVLPKERIYLVDTTEYQKIAEEEQIGFIPSQPPAEMLREIRLKGSI